MENDLFVIEKITINDRIKLATLFLENLNSLHSDERDSISKILQYSNNTEVLNKINPCLQVFDK